MAQTVRPLSRAEQQVLTLYRGLTPDEQQSVRLILYVLRGQPLPRDLRAMSDRLSREAELAQRVQ